MSVTYDDLRAAERDYLMAEDELEASTAARLAAPGSSAARERLVAALDAVDEADDLVVTLRRAIGRQNVKVAAEVLGATIE